MRALNSAIIGQKQGLEPVTIVGVNWQGAGEVYYGDDAYENVSPKILNLPELDQSMNVEGSGVASSITVKFDDTDSTIWKLLGQTDIYLARVSVYQWFKGYSLDLKVKMFEGMIVGPVTWDEGSRSVEIQCTTRLSNVQVGFSYDETNVNILHQSLLGKVWPLTFGTPIHYPALQLQEIPSGITLKSFGIPDPSIFWQLAKLRYEIAEAEAPYQKLIGNLVSALDSSQSSIQQNFNDFYIPRLQAEMRQNTKSLQDQWDILIKQYNQQLDVFSTSNSIIGGYKFPQHVPLKCKIGDQLFTCTFLGNATVTNPNQACPVHIVPFYPPGYPGSDSDPTQQKYTYNFPDLLSQYSTRLSIPVPQGLSGVAIPPWGLTYPVVKEGFTWVSAGSNLTLIDEFDFEFLAAYVPGSVVNVYAYKSFNGTRKLTQVPSRYYSIRVNGNVTTIVMKRPLSIISYLINLRTTEAEDYLNMNASDFNGTVKPHVVDNVDWEDQIYVTFQSSIGPNIVDILVWLITHYTPYGYDVTTFDHVRPLVANYPANFVVEDRPLVDDLMNDICYQSRCSLILKDGFYYLKYLSAFPPAFEQITLDDIDEKSLQVTTTPVESLITRYTATWKADFSPDHASPNKIILKNNINKYGIIDGGHDFFIYNQFYLVQKSAYFWMLRQSNVFKILKFNCSLDKLNLEVGDAVLISFAEPIFASQDVICEITDLGYDTEKYVISMTLSTYVRLGQMLPYLFAYPASLTETDYFFPSDAITGGASQGYNPGQFGTPPPYNYLARYEQTVDYSSWPQDPGDILGYNQSMQAWSDSAQAQDRASFNSTSQLAADQDSSRGDINLDPFDKVSNFHGGAPVHVADTGNPTNNSNQMNTHIPYFDPEIPATNPQLSPDFTVPPTEKPAAPPGGSGSSASGYPGQIIGKVGDTVFSVRSFPNGLDHDAVVVNCNEVHNDVNLMLDTGVWVTVLVVGNAYYLVQPSWAH